VRGYLVTVVVPDGLEPDREPRSRPAAGWLVALGVVALAALLFASRGGGEVPDTGTTVPTVPDVVGPDSGWRLLDLPGTHRLLDVTRLDAGGYAAVGDGPQFWYSPDGQTWSLGDLRSDDVGEATGVAEYDGLVAAVGSVVSESGERRASIWVSEQGANWERVLTGTKTPAALEGVTAGPNRLYAWGWRGSDQDFSPDTGSLVLASTDGRNWTDVGGIPEEARIHRIVNLDGTWYATGLETGQAAVWREEGGSWTAMSSAGFPFGWAMMDLRSNDSGLIANLAEVGLGPTRSFREGADGTWVPLTDPLVNGPVVMLSSELAVGAGQLWKDGPEWSPIDLEGDVASVAGDVAVGSTQGQPALWVHDARTVPRFVHPATPPSDTWEEKAGLGRGQVQGPWPVANGWLVGVDSKWWFLGDGEPVVVTELDGASITAVDRVGNEWVALPDMLWSADGVAWDQRPLPWESADTKIGYVAAVSVFQGGIQAIGQDDSYLWMAAVSSDSGHSWQVVQRSAITPVYRIRPIPAGYVGVAARPRSTEGVVESSDGFEWEGLSSGELIDASQPPAILETDGLVFLDDGTPVAPPRRDVTAVTRTEDGSIMVVAGGSLWIEKGEGSWSNVPLDPRHGVDGAVVAPLAAGSEPLILVSDHQRVTLMGWNG
jgi:hypothetical protein